MSQEQYDPKAREARAFAERMALTTFKPKAIEFLNKAEGAADAQLGQYFATIAQAYATLELARVSASNQTRSKSN